MIKAEYFYNLVEFQNDSLIMPLTVQPYGNTSFKDFITKRLQMNVASDLPAFPFAITDSNVEKVWQEVVSSNYRRFILKTTEEIVNPSIDITHLKEWAYKLINLLSQSYDYFNTLLVNYAASKDSLMADIKATSKNKVKFNDTPQNSNLSGTYEGDDYITHFTSTDGETSSPLMSKIMRLKEIQENYKDALHDWANYLSRAWFTEGEQIMQNKEFLGGIFGTVLSATGTAMQPSEVLQIISLIITIVGGLITLIIIPLWTWWHKAKADGKITEDEVKEGLETAQQGIEQFQQTLNDKKKGDK